MPTVANVPVMLASDCSLSLFAFWVLRADLERLVLPSAALSFLFAGMCVGQIAKGTAAALAGLIETNPPHNSDAISLVAHVMPRIDINAYYFT